MQQQPIVPIQQLFHHSSQLECSPVTCVKRRHMLGGIQTLKICRRKNVLCDVGIHLTEID